MKNNLINKLLNKKILILGFGVEGKSTYKFIRKNLDDIKLYIGANTDLSSEELLENDNNVELITGDNYLDNLNDYDLIIKSPGISLKDIDISNIKDKITSQVELLLEVNSKNVIGITGTKGKSTTSKLLYEMLIKNNVDALLLGNIGNPILDDIDRIKEDTKLVVELSSHQLEFIKVSPHIGVILNMYEDHLDHAGTLKHYHESKLNMFKYMNEKDISIYVEGSKYLDDYMLNNNYKSKIITIGKDIYIENNYVIYNNKKTYDITTNTSLIGIHNVKNIMVCLLISELLNLDIDKCIEAIKEFKTLENRLELLDTINGITYYSDTIATIPEATLKGIEGLKCVNTLIFGGMNRGINYDDFSRELENTSVENFICMPETGHIVGKNINNKNVYFVDTLEQAVIKAKEVTKKDSICLLSPAAPSYNKYKNYIEKGNAFKELIKD